MSMKRKRRKNIIKSVSTSIKLVLIWKEKILIILYKCIQVLILYRSRHKRIKTVKIKICILFFQSKFMSRICESKEDGNYVTHVNRDEKGYKKVDDGRQKNYRNISLSEI